MQVFESFSLNAQSLWTVNVLLQVTVVAAMALLIVRFITNTAVLRWWVLASALMLILISPVTSYLTQANGVGFLSIASTESNMP